MKQNIKSPLKCIFLLLIYTESHADTYKVFYSPGITGEEPCYLEMYFTA
jgi:hypothetical protein